MYFYFVSETDPGRGSSMNQNIHQCVLCIHQYKSKLMESINLLIKDRFWYAGWIPRLPVFIIQIGINAHQEKHIKCPSFVELVFDASVIDALKALVHCSMDRHLDCEVTTNELSSLLPLSRRLPTFSVLFLSLLMKPRSVFKANKRKAQKPD